jgi:hypothetical protein
MSTKTPTIHLYTPAMANLVIQQGVTKVVALCRWLPGGVSPYVWQPGDVARLQIRDAAIAAGGVVLAGAATDGVAPKLFFDAGDNFIKWRLEKVTSAAWTWASGYYDLDVITGSDELTLLTGLIEMRKQVAS